MKRMAKAAEQVLRTRRRKLKEMPLQGGADAAGSAAGPGWQVMTRLAYYPGRSLHGTARELDSSPPEPPPGGRAGRDPQLGVPRKTAAHAASRLLATALPANELAKVGSDMQQLDSVVVPCAACYSRFQFAKAELDHDDQLRKETEQVVGRHSRLTSRCSTSSTSTRTSLGLGCITGQGSSAPWGGIRSPRTNGCLLTRPPRSRSPRTQSIPLDMTDVLKTLGASGRRYKTDARALSPRSASKRSSCSSHVVYSRTPAIVAPRPSPAPARSAKPILRQADVQGNGPHVARHPDLLPQPARRPRLLAAKMGWKKHMVPVPALP